MSPNDLNRKLDDQPFKPFRIRLVDNPTYDIVDPGMVIVGDTSAVIATRNIRDESGHRVTTDWRTVPIRHMLEFSDLVARISGGKGRRKGSGTGS
jgi:hypothetical protein